MAETHDFRYLLDEFADIRVMRFRIPGWDSLTLRQKKYAWHLSEAAKWGRDILWDQNCKGNLRLRHTLETILESYRGDRECEEYGQFLTYAKRVFFANGIHHHYAEDKIFPECSRSFFRELMEACGCLSEAVLDYIYDPDAYPQRRCTSAAEDIVKASGVNFYEGVSRDEVESFYAAMEKPGDTHPVAYGLNSKVIRDNGKVTEIKWKSGGLYGAAIDRICEELLKAAEVAENDTQSRALHILVDYYRTGDLEKWDEFNIEWLRDTSGTVDFINGFIEDYNDPLGRKGAWEGYVHIKDMEASRRTETMSAHAQWFEDHSPVDPRFKKKECRGITAKVVNAVCLAGDSYPATPIGINLPNSDGIRKEHGSKSVTIANITRAFDMAARECPASVLDEFGWSEEEIAFEKKYGPLADEIHTDLHECLGHGSGQLLPGVSSTAMGEYSSTLEEARADLFGLYYAADPELVRLGIMPSEDAYKAEYTRYIRNGLIVQLNRIELGRDCTEAHMQNRKLISEWCLEKGAPAHVIERRVRDGKTYFTVNDFTALRGLFAELLAEVQRIKSEGDYQAGKALVERYGVKIDPVLHREVRQRYDSLGLKPYGGFINPDIRPVSRDGEIIDCEVVYNEDYIGQMLTYGKKYRTLD
ncbi:MAG: dihydrofolate reductase [Bacteroidales bacterium]|nr:dihydrofolate reductase [Candidatus Cryptobacteroides onthequi]